MHGQLYLAVSHMYGSVFLCLNMDKMSIENNSDLKDTEGIPSLNIVKLFYFVGSKLGG